MGRKEKRRGKRRVKKKGTRVGEEAAAETQVNLSFPNILKEVVVEILSRLLQAGAEAETQANPSFPNIPEEIVAEILSRLPLPSLPRFTCVSKQWRSLVPDIIAKKSGKKVVLVAEHKEKMVLVRSILRSDTLAFHTIDEESRVEQVTKPLESNKFTNYPLFFGSCDGLLLIRIGDGLFLWNPVTRYFKKVLSYEPLEDCRSARASGLCYDSSTNEYKAVMALDIHCGGVFVAVGSFRSKNWTRIEFPYRINTLKSGPAVNGDLHWYVSDENPNHSYSSHQILYFNPQTNQFSKLPTPEPRNGSGGNMILGLGVLDGCLSMVRHECPSCFSEANNTVEVLAMKEYGMQESWTKLFSIPNLAFRSYDKLEPLCYTKDGKALMKDFLMDDDLYMSRSGPSVRVYDPINSFYKRIQVQPRRHRVVDVIMYEESLVTPTDYNWEEEELRGEPTYVEYYSYRPPLKWVKRGNRRWDQLEIEEEDYEQPNTRRNINNTQTVLD